MTAGPLTQNPAQLLAEASLSAALSKLQAQFDLLIVDSAPVLGLADAVSLASHTAVTIFVIEAGRTKAREVRSALERLDASGINVVGAILTKYDLKSPGYSY